MQESRHRIVSLILLVCAALRFQTLATSHLGYGIWIVMQSSQEPTPTIEIDMFLHGGSLMNVPMATKRAIR